MEIAAELPEPIAQAHAAAVEESAFSFEAAELVVSAMPQPQEPDTGADFHFFSDQGD